MVSGPISQPLDSSGDVDSSGGFDITSKNPSFPPNCKAIILHFGGKGGFLKFVVFG